MADGRKDRGVQKFDGKKNMRTSVKVYKSGKGRS